MGISIPTAALMICHYYLRRRLACGKGIVSLCVRLSRCHAVRVCVRRISLGGEGNALYPVLSSSVFHKFAVLFYRGFQCISSRTLHNVVLTFGYTVFRL